MIVLDSDHLSVLLDTRHAKRSPLLDRLKAAASELIGIPIVAVEEHLRGWLAKIASAKNSRQ